MESTISWGRRSAIEQAYIQLYGPKKLSSGFQLFCPFGHICSWMALGVRCWVLCCLRACPRNPRRHGEWKYFYRLRQVLYFCQDEEVGVSDVLSRKQTEDEELLEDDVARLFGFGEFSMWFSCISQGCLSHSAGLQAPSVLRYELRKRSGSLQARPSCARLALLQAVVLEKTSVLSCQGHKLLHVEHT